jgi:hypothetical protein
MARPANQDPESFKRLRSGFWRRDYDLATQNERWTCDVKKLREEVGRAMIDRDFSQRVSMYGLSRVLDEMFGDWTAKAFHTKLQGDSSLVQMQVPDFMREDPRRARYMGYDLARDDKADAMAYWTGTTTNTTTTTAGTSGWYELYGNKIISDNAFFKKETEKAIKRATDKISFRKRRVKTFPFKGSKHTSLLDQLQQEFDHWAGNQLKVICD